MEDLAHEFRLHPVRLKDDFALFVRGNLHTIVAQQLSAVPFSFPRSLRHPHLDVLDNGAPLVLSDGAHHVHRHSARSG